MTSQELIAIGIPKATFSAEEILMCETAFEWLKNNTILEFDIDDQSTLEALPAGAKLFVVKFCEIMSTPNNVASESIDGLSQSFVTTNRTTLLFDIAAELLGHYLKSGVAFVCAKRRWIE